MVDVMLKPLFLVVTLVFSVVSRAQNPSDSVIDSSLRGRGGVYIAPGNIGATSLMHSVPLASQTNENIFVDYGPFVNKTASSMTISLVSKGMNGRRTLVAGLQGGPRYEGNDALTLIVPPGAVFGFSVKDYAEITASVEGGYLGERPLGIPSAADFKNPTGRYLGCIDYRAIQEDGTEVSTGISYLYEAGSMSDGSIRRDYINQSSPNITGGLQPENPGVCRLG